MLKILLILTEDLAAEIASMIQTNSEEVEEQRAKSIGGDTDDHEAASVDIVANIDGVEDSEGGSPNSGAVEGAQDDPRSSVDVEELEEISLPLSSHVELQLHSSH